MKRKLFATATMVGALVMLQTPLTFAGDDVTSLRGANDLNADAKMFDKKKQLKKEGGFERAWDLQPPSIPHGIEKDSITLQGNTCLRCHSKANHEKEKAPVVGESHFLNREGEVLEKISDRRWFCNQCHTPQVDSAPLVENSF